MTVNRISKGLDPDHVPMDGVGLAATASVAVLLCTRDGERFLEEQIASISRQTHQNFKIYVSDDGSSDSTRAIVTAHVERLGHECIELTHGPVEGFARNFLSVSCRADVNADYYAWCDQDDIWNEDKLQIAVDKLAGGDSSVPALYCSRTELIDEHGQSIGFSSFFSKPATFQNALVQNIAGGNTMVFNQALMDLIREAGDRVPAASHDWWAYMIVSGCNGRIYYDSTPTVRYRQHSLNCIGTNRGFRNNSKRAKELWRGRYQRWIDNNIVSLQVISHRFTAENRKILERFSEARKNRFFGRLWGFMRSGVYRQTLIGNLGLVVAVIMRRV
ncbi:glycosyltransferase family 2 protein [Pseudomonas sp. S3E12]|uniref:glycosyltransferase family 2 protein n=1 Tax=Pseudomonas sp. S3E12 TaxID=1873126 RepID=UPI000AB2988D|nr:glycosyltransferase family 2 protein [Pseudomonas sp. S3E12]